MFLMVKNKIFLIEKGACIPMNVHGYMLLDLFGYYLSKRLYFE